MFLRFILFNLCFLSISFSFAQGCCSGGGSNPIAGGAATGVLQKNQVEFSVNHQLMSSNKFYTENRDTTALFENLNSNYLFLRVDYGLSDKLTLSVASGYFMNKSLIELEQEDTTSSKGFSDIIVLPRFDVFNKTKGNVKSELTLGLGLKIPIGTHSDSSLVFSHPLVGDIYSINPPTVQTTNGSIDLMLYSFFFRSYIKQKIRIFANALYVKRGFNSLGQKFGDYTSVGLFVGKTFFRKIGLTAQLRGEWIGQMKAARNIDLLSNYNIEQASTGSRKLFFVPQVSFIHKSFVFFATSEVPLYQYVRGTQVGSQFQLTTGINYRFLTKKNPLDTKECEPE